MHLPALLATLPILPAIQCAPDHPSNLPADAATSVLVLSLAQPAQADPEPPPSTAAEPPPNAPDSAAPPSFSIFGHRGSDWLTLSGGVADKYGESTDFNLSLAWSRFTWDRVELGGEAGFWYFDQERDPTVGANGTFFLRWHFLSHEGWSLFLDPGMGVQLSGDNVPDGGTSFNLTPRGGIGTTFRILEDDTRLMFGVRWQHISNGNFGDTNTNPSRDSALLYAGVILPF